MRCPHNDSLSRGVLRLLEEHILLFFIAYIVNIVTYKYITLLVQQNAYVQLFIHRVKVGSHGVCVSQALIRPKLGVDLRPALRRLASAVNLNPASSTVLYLSVLLRAGPTHRLDEYLAHMNIDVLQLDL